MGLRRRPIQPLATATAANPTAVDPGCAGAPVHRVKLQNRPRIEAASSGSGSRGVAALAAAGSNAIHRAPVAKILLISDRIRPRRRAATPLSQG